MTGFFLAVLTAWSVVDGDTLDVKGYIWAKPVRTIEERVRFVRVDAPETRGVPECEKALAAKAKAWTAERLAAGKRHVLLLTTDEREQRDNFGRVMVDVIVDGVSLSDAGIAAGVFRPYVRPKVPWC